MHTTPHCGTTDFKCFSRVFMFFTIFTLKQKHAKPVVSHLSYVFNCKKRHHFFINIYIYIYKCTDSHTHLYTYTHTYI